VSVQAQAYAVAGNAVGCDRALGQAEERFTAIDPATRPPWGAHLDSVDLAACRGNAYHELAFTRGDPRTAAQAVPLLGHAVDHFGPAYARAQAIYLPDLAGAYALGGDADTAVAVGHQAVDAVTAVSSPRAHDRLHTLHTVLEPLHTSPGVAELRDRLTATAA
jgi:hypothetical protein